MKYKAILLEIKEEIASMKHLQYGSNHKAKLDTLFMMNNRILNKLENVK